MSDELCEAPDNIIDLMPYLEGQKFGWTADMTHALLKQGEVPVLVKHVEHKLVLNEEEFLKP